MLTLRLPPVVYEDGLADFLTRLGWVTTQAGSDNIEVDFQDAQFYMPGALTALLAAVHRWTREGRRVQFANVLPAPAFRYLQRMDFFKLSGLSLPEAFMRHDAKGRFVPLHRVDGTLARRVDELSRQIAACVYPAQADSDDPERTGPFDIVAYAVSELINNIIQHAKGPGYLAVQRYPNKPFVCIGIADCGIGIRQSFEDGRPEFWDPAMTHMDAVRTALQPRASSKAHLASGWGERINEGVGLSMLKEITAGADGVFTLASGDGFFQANTLQKRPWPNEVRLLAPFGGTLCSLLLSKQKLGNHQLLLLQAKRRIGLLQEGGPFDNLFV
jgi:hypothetical protein